MKKKICLIWGIGLVTLLCACAAQESTGASQDHIMVFEESMVQEKEPIEEVEGNPSKVTEGAQIPYEEIEVYTVLPERDALDLVYNTEYADSENMVDVSFYETEEVIGYKWYWYDTTNNPMYLTLRDYVLDLEGRVYYIVRLGSDLYDSLGGYMRTEVYNEFAVDMISGEIIEMRVYREEGGWDYSEEYLEKLGGTKPEEMEAGEVKEDELKSMEEWRLSEKYRVVGDME